MVIETISAFLIIFFFFFKFAFLDEEESTDRTFMYYVNDGVYGSFNCILYDHAHVKPLLQKVPSKCVVYTS